MPITLSAELRKKISARLAAITAAHAEFSNASKGVSKMEADAESLANEIAADEAAADLSDTAVLQAIESKRSRLRIIRQRIQGAPAPDDSALKDALKESGLLVAAACEPAIEEQLTTIAATLAPFYREADDARRAAEQTDSIQSYKHFCRYSAGGFSSEDPVRGAVHFIRVFKALLDGVEPFVFQA
jgi:hypothetical protein